MHVALGFKTFKRHSAIVLDWVLNKGQRFAVFYRSPWELVGFWSPGSNQTCSGEGSLTCSDGTSSSLVIGLLLSTRPSRGSPDPPDRWGTVPVPGGPPLSHAARGCWSSPARHMEEVVHHMLRNSVMVGQISHVPPFACLVQWKSPESHFPSSQFTRSVSIALQWTRDDCRDVRKR